MLGKFAGVATGTLEFEVFFFFSGDGNSSCIVFDMSMPPSKDEEELVNISQQYGPGFFAASPEGFVYSR